ncbi:adaptin N terminal region-domain-containing protein [Dipodascopsis tothii]|uniref:adaptin N terminal region-domain-containing protein n=1 Tax=Dipodascopsis tothii TaxID=44089 RepID=UPI0034CE9BC4
MSDAKYFAKGKAAELKLELVSDKRDKNYARKRTALKKIVANMTMNNNEMVTLFPDIIQCMVIDNMEIKKMCFLYLINYSRVKPEMATRALPTLLEDLGDRSPLMRALALRTISCVPVAAFVKAALGPLRQLLEDTDPYVRKTAVYAVAKLWHHDRRLVEDAGVIDQVNRLLVDSNPTVVSAALASLVDITSKSEGMKLTVDHRNASKLVQILPDCNEWSQTYILQALTAYTPQDSNDALIMAERLTPRLQHSNSAVVLGTIRVILYLSRYISDADEIRSLVKRFGPPLVTLLSKPYEIQYVTLRNCFLILQEHPEVLQHEIRVFFCKYNDPIYVKVTKLEIIFLLATEHNIGAVLREVKDYSSEIDVQFARKAVRAIGKLAIKIETAAQRCIDALLELVATRVSYIVQEATVVIKNIFRRYPNRYEGIISVLCQNLDSLDEPEAKAAMIWIIGQYADRIDNSDELLDDFLFTFKDETIEVQLALLTATVKLFVLRPSKGQELVPKVLRWATEETDNPDLRDRGYMYWRLLSTSATNADLTREIIMGHKPPISVESDRLDDRTLEEMTLNLGSLAAVYMKPANQIFKGAKTRHLDDSPALRRRPSVYSSSVSSPTSTSTSEYFAPGLARQRSFLQMQPANTLAMRPSLGSLNSSGPTTASSYTNGSSASAGNSNGHGNEGYFDMRHFNAVEADPINTPAFVNPTARSLYPSNDEDLLW